ncbi:hypothetical protein LK994_02320 [Ferruginibacter lapsinanis]|uniref:hypothetical protein n=1 Tax=Ferruginibacter lapsinanis TaxID=563172 RepID=UPI001E5D3139|nr:hypothetical protein [Ferruginibacter lapsinanis]UEG50309.1 hypothetical protein LK994_02320 [Ferruginibacter lapsinanis]
MIKKEYLTVKELAEHHKISIRSIRQKIAKLEPTTTKDLLRKDINKSWEIHHILVSRFKPQRQSKSKYYALTIDPCRHINESDIHEIMNFVSSRINQPSLEINYVVEKKKANNQNHIHCYTNCKKRAELIENLRLGFSNVVYNEATVWDLEGWKAYMTKDGCTITKIKK